MHSASGCGTTSARCAAIRSRPVEATETVSDAHLPRSIPHVRVPCGRFEPGRPWTAAPPRMVVIHASARGRMRVKEMHDGQRMVRLRIRHPVVSPCSMGIFSGELRFTYNAPPGTQQRMAVYFYASPLGAEPTRDAVLAFTHGDTFKPVPGYKTMVNHFHIRFVDCLRASGSVDTPICSAGRDRWRRRRRSPTPASCRSPATRSRPGSRTSSRGRRRSSRCS